MLIGTNSNLASANRHKYFQIKEKEKKKIDNDDKNQTFNSSERLKRAEN